MVTRPYLALTVAIWPTATASVPTPLLVLQVAVTITEAAPLVSSRLARRPRASSSSRSVSSPSARPSVATEPVAAAVVNSCRSPWPPRPAAKLLQGPAHLLDDGRGIVPPTWYRPY